jgi:hypothetical protein
MPLCSHFRRNVNRAGKRLMVGFLHRCTNFFCSVGGHCLGGESCPQVFDFFGGTSNGAANFLGVAGDGFHRQSSGNRRCHNHSRLCCGLDCLRRSCGSESHLPKRLGGSCKDIQHGVFSFCCCVSRFPRGWGAIAVAQYIMVGGAGKIQTPPATKTYATPMTLCRSSALTSSWNNP